MTWDFTPTQVMTGEIDYGFDDFHRDLFNEMKVNFGERLPPEQLESAFYLTWVFCHLKATLLSLEEIQTQMSHEETPMTKEGVEILNTFNKENAEMLMGIYQRLFIQFYKKTLLNSWGDNDKAVSEAIAMLNLYINKHLNACAANISPEGTPRKRSLPL